MFKFLEICCHKIEGATGIKIPGGKIKGDAVIYNTGYMTPDQVEKAGQALGGADVHYDGGQLWVRGAKIEHRSNAPRIERY